MPHRGEATTQGTIHAYQHETVAYQHETSVVGRMLLTFDGDPVGFTFGVFDLDEVGNPLNGLVSRATRDGLGGPAHHLSLEHLEHRMITGDTVMLDYGDGDTGYTAIILELGVIPDTEPRAVAYTACPRYVGLPGALLDWNEI